MPRINDIFCRYTLVGDTWFNGRVGKLDKLRGSLPYDCWFESSPYQSVVLSIAFGLFGEMVATVVLETIAFTGVLVQFRQ